MGGLAMRCQRPGCKQRATHALNCFLRGFDTRGQQRIWDISLAAICQRCARSRRQNFWQLKRLEGWLWTDQTKSVLQIEGAVLSTLEVSQMVALRNYTLDLLVEQKKHASKKKTKHPAVGKTKA